MSLAVLNTTVPFKAADFRGKCVEDSKPVAREDEDSLFGELEIEFLEKVNQMRSLTERLALRLESSLRCEVLKLPLSVRSMTMREFCEECGGDVEEAIRQAAKRRKAVDMMPPPPPMMLPPARPKASDPDAPGGGRATRGSRNAPAAAGPAHTPSAAGGRATRARVTSATPGAAGMATPSVGGSGSTSMMTPRMHETPRFARMGEIMLSTNGSPINALNTIKAKAGKRGRVAAVVLELADGSEIDLAEAGKDLELNAETREEAVDQLIALQAQIEAHIKAIRQGCPTDDSKEE